MQKKVFVSYCHQQGEWVWDRLVPCLKVGGAEVLIDRERFQAGKAVVGQMDAIQDEADVHLPILSSDYLASPYCLHEMERAIARDPDFHTGRVVPVLRVVCPLPNAIAKPNPLFVDLCNDQQVHPWDVLLNACGADLGATVPEWLRARDEVRSFLGQQQSVNLVIHGAPRWRKLIEHLRTEHLKDLGVVDLEDGRTASRRGLVTEILRAGNRQKVVPPEPEDLITLAAAFASPPPVRLAVKHFDHVLARPHYGSDLFAALRHLIMEVRSLVLLVQSRAPFATLLPHGHPLSVIDIKTVELRGRP